MIIWYVKNTGRNDIGLLLFDRFYTKLYLNEFAVRGLKDFFPFRIPGCNITIAQGESTVLCFDVSCDP